MSYDGHGFSTLTSGSTRCARKRNCSGSENLTLAIPSPHSMPCRHGNPAGITTRGVGMDPTRGASLYSGAGSACGDLDIHGPRLTAAGRHVAGTAAPDVTEFFPPPVERSAPASTSTSPSGATPSWRATGPSWRYAHPDTCGRSRCGGGHQARAVHALPGSLIGRRSQAMAASSDRAPADQTGGDRVSMASAGVPDVRRDHTRALACRRSQRDLRPSRASDGSAIYGVVPLVQTHDAASDGEVF